ncbi:MAG: hypothetical protein AAGD11_01880 [Planctomycetota bacterium]
MKKSLALLAIATLLVGVSGCGCCRGLFGRSSVGTVGPFYGRLAPRAVSGPCCNTCAPMCNDCNTCTSAPSCGCESSTPVTYGYEGAAYEGATIEMPMADGAIMESTPMTVPAGSGTFGQ